MINKVKIGADPELFLYNLNTEDYDSAVGRIGGTKEFPIKVSEDGYALQEDNIMVEFNIPPASTKTEFVDSIQFMLAYINTILPDHLITKIEPAAYIDFDLLQNEQAMTFGCSPDYNAWTHSENPKPLGEITNLRTCGGHIHIGYDNPNLETSEKLIKTLDLYVGIPMLLLEPDNKRKELYGNYGACRFKSYGVEYRTPSNYWLTNDELIGFIYDQVHAAINAINNGFDPNLWHDKVVDCFENNNKNTAYQVIEKLSICNLTTVKTI